MMYAGDEFYDDEITSGVTPRQPVPDDRFLLGFTNGDTQLDAYLGFGATFSDPPITLRSGKAIRIIRVPLVHATWQARRLESGLRGGHRIYALEADARADAAELVDLL